MDINQEINKHLDWIEAVASLIGNEALSNDDVVKLSQHDRCDLGKWLASDESESLRTYPEFQNLQESHKDFHSLAGELILALHAGDEAKSMSSARAFIGASEQVVSYLKELQQYAEAT